MGWQQEMEMSIVGLQNAGKSTFIHVIQKGEYVPDMIPTVGFNMHKVDKGKVSIKVWDLGGQNKFPNSKKELHSLLSSPSLNGIPLLLLFNKNDLPDARPAEEIVAALGVKSLKGREIAYYEISCKDILNIDTTLDWLIKHSK